jgi:hypothetical protein
MMLTLFGASVDQVLWMIFFGPLLLVAMARIFFDRLDKDGKARQAIKEKATFSIIKWLKG